jgi:hypothetical protein
MDRPVRSVVPGRVVPPHSRDRRRQQESVARSKVIREPFNPVETVAIIKLNCAFVDGPDSYPELVVVVPFEKLYRRREESGTDPLALSL